MVNDLALVRLLPPFLSIGSRKLDRDLDFGVGTSGAQNRVRVMSVKMALAKLCACAAGGAIIGGGAVHVSANPPSRPVLVKKAKAETVRTYRTHRVKRAKPIRVAKTE